MISNIIRKSFKQINVFNNRKIGIENLNKFYSTEGWIQY